MTALHTVRDAARGSVVRAVVVSAVVVSAVVAAVSLGLLARLGHRTHRRQAHHGGGVADTARRWP